MSVLSDYYALGGRFVDWAKKKSTDSYNTTMIVNDNRDKRRGIAGRPRVYDTKSSPSRRECLNVRVEEDEEER